MAVNVKFTLAGLTAGGFRVYSGSAGLFPLESEASSPTDLAVAVKRIIGCLLYLDAGCRLVRGS